MLPVVTLGELTSPMTRSMLRFSLSEAVPQGAMLQPPWPGMV